VFADRDCNAGLAFTGRAENAIKGQLSALMGEQTADVVQTTP
jgi:hypothetical protein